MLVIRADASSEIGIGHVMRCLALAQEAKRRDLSVRFLARVPPPLAARLEGEGMELHAIPDGMGVQDEIDLLLRESEGALAVVLDHYGCDASYQRAIREAGHRLLVVDDYKHLPSYDCDYLLNQNLSAFRYQYSTKAQLLLGSEYALLRSEFCATPRPEASSRTAIVKILLTIGGGNFHDFLLEVIHALSRLDARALSIRAILGPSFAAPATIQETCRALGVRVDVIQNPATMPPHYAWADAVISSGGSSLYEMAYFCLPVLAFPLVENQRDIVSVLSDRGALVDGSDRMRTGKLKQAVHDFLGSPSSSLQTLAMKIGSVVDGKGAERVLDVLQSH